MKTETERTRSRYDRIAPVYEVMDRMAPNELRRRVISQTRGRVLEIGVGTGKNLPFYPKDVDLTAIDLSPKMLTRARRRAEALGLDVRLLEMDAEALKLPDDSFDTVVATFVFCSVPDPVAGLREVDRVLKPDGQLILLEHVRSEGRLLGPLMDLLNPIAVRVTGANINRETVDNVRSAGLAAQEVQDERFGRIVKLILARPEGDVGQ